MNILKNLLTSGSSELVSSVGKALDDNITNEQERLEATAKIKESLYEFTDKVLEASDKMEQHVSDRHAVDMQSDSWLSKNIRPLSFVVSYIILMYLLFMQIENDKAFDIVNNILTIQLSFYFIGRTGEKITKVIKGVSAFDQTTTTAIQKPDGIIKTWLKNRRKK